MVAEEIGQSGLGAGLRRAKDARSAARMSRLAVRVTRAEFAATLRTMRVPGVRQARKDSQDSPAPADQLRRALATRTTIGVAIGIVMERFGLDQDSAWAFLQRVSSRQNVKVVDLARLIIDHGLPDDIGSIRSLIDDSRD